MTRVYSKYKIFGGFGLFIGLNLLIGSLTFQLLTRSKISYDKVDIINDEKALLAYSIIIGLNLLFLTLMATQCRFIIADKNGITFINPLIPFLKKTRLWTDFDYFILVDEASQYDTYEAVWLIKDGKIKGRISSFNYLNYKDLKKQLKQTDMEKNIMDHSNNYLL